MREYASPKSSASSRRFALSGRLRLQERRDAQPPAEGRLGQRHREPAVRRVVGRRQDPGGRRFEAGLLHPAFKVQVQFGQRPFHDAVQGRQVAAAAQSRGDRRPGRPGRRPRRPGV